MRSSLGVNCFSSHSMAIIKSIDLNEGRCFHLQTKSFKNLLLLLLLPSWQHSTLMAQLVCVTFPVRSTLPSSFHDELQLLVISLKNPRKGYILPAKKKRKKEKKQKSLIFKVLKLCYLYLWLQLYGLR